MMKFRFLERCLTIMALVWLALPALAETKLMVDGTVYELQVEKRVLEPGQILRIGETCSQSRYWLYVNEVCSWSKTVSATESDLVLGDQGGQSIKTQLRPDVLIAMISIAAMLMALTLSELGAVTAATIAAATAATIATALALAFATATIATVFAFAFAAAFALAIAAFAAAFAAATAAFATVTADRSETRLWAIVYLVFMAFHLIAAW